MQAKKNQRIKSILGFLQQDVPGAPVNAQAMDQVEAAPQDQQQPDDAAPPDDAQMPGLPEKPMPPGLEMADDLVRKRKKRRGLTSADAFQQALQPQNVNSSY